MAEQNISNFTMQFCYCVLFVHYCSVVIFTVAILVYSYEPLCTKVNAVTYGTSIDPDQHGYLHSLIKVYTDCLHNEF